MAAFTTNSDFFNHLNAHKTPHVFLTAETEDFDESIINAWKAEGFSVQYIPLENAGASYTKTLHSLHDRIGVGEQYAIVGTSPLLPTAAPSHSVSWMCSAVYARAILSANGFTANMNPAFGEAATIALESQIHPKNPRICALIAYYPSAIPAPTATKYPPHMQVLVHLCGESIGVRRNPEVLGIQGKRKTVRKRLDPGLGIGGELKLSYACYVYPDVDPGFAESDLEEFDLAATEVAWERSLRVVRRGFNMRGVEEAMERVRDQFIADATKSPEKALSSLSLNQTASTSTITFAPTLASPSASTLASFYSSIFTSPPSSTASNPNISTMLLSRTISTSRIVDELLLSFTHTAVLPWILPNIPPTGKRVEVVVVSIVCIKGGKLESERVYWDQASVLVQVGLLDPALLPKGTKGVKRLPAVGKEGADTIAGFADGD